MSEPQAPKPPPPAGWYVDPDMPGTQRYWDGAAWSEHVAPWTGNPDGTYRQTPKSPSQVSAALVVAGAALGLILAMQSASLMSGTGMLWFGVAICAAGSVASWALKGVVPAWARVVAVVAFVVALANVLYVESQLEEMRQDIGSIFDE